MAKKISFSQRHTSQNALNEFENQYGRQFNALVMVRTAGSDKSSIYKNQNVFILRGQYDNHNMPFVSVLDMNYDSAYTIIENNGDCLTIKLADKTIDILPQEDEGSDEEKRHE